MGGGRIALPATSSDSGGTHRMPLMTDTATTPVTFVCCVESGALEDQAVRLAASLRQWGGTFAVCPFLAITPRRGAPLRRDTRQAFDDLEVIYIRENVREPFAWFKFMAKLSAAACGGAVRIQRTCSSGLMPTPW